MAFLPTIDERDATDTTPLPNHRRTGRLIALYAALALLAVIIGIAVGIQRHSATATGSITVPTEQSVVATAQPGVPTPTPLATKPPSPTPVVPTNPPPTTLPPIAPPESPPPVVAAPVRPAPAVTTNQNGQHDNGKGNGNGKGRGHDKGD